MVPHSKVLAISSSKSTAALGAKLGCCCGSDGASCPAGRCTGVPDTTIEEERPWYATGSRSLQVGQEGFSHMTAGRRWPAVRWQSTALAHCLSFEKRWVMEGLRCLLDALQASSASVPVGVQSVLRAAEHGADVGSVLP
jgi:hypothetical protein